MRVLRKRAPTCRDHPPFATPLARCRPYLLDVHRAPDAATRPMNCGRADPFSTAVNAGPRQVCRLDHGGSLSPSRQGLSMSGRA